MHLNAEEEEEWCFRGEVVAADGEGEVTRGQHVGREGRGCSVELSRGKGAGPSLTFTLSRDLGARLLSSQPSPDRA